MGPRKDPARLARRYFEDGFNCAESLLLAVTESRGKRPACAPRIATAFGGGMANTNQACGALTGGVMAIGILLGRDGPDDSRKETYAAAQAYTEAFRSAFGDTGCTALLGVDLGTPEGKKAFDEQNLHERCLDIVGRAAALLDEILP